jgi:hypothetical protein
VEKIKRWKDQQRFVVGFVVGQAARATATAASFRQAKADIDTI